MFWIVLIVGGLVGFLCLVAVSLWIIGGRLPEQHEAVARRHFLGAPEVLFEQVSDPDQLMGWRPDLTAVERLPAIDEQPAWRESGKFGRMQLVVEECQPPTIVAPGRFVTRIAESSSSFGGRWIWVFEPHGDGGTQITLTEQGVIASRITRAMVHHLMGVQGRVEQVLATLAMADAQRGRAR